MISLIVTRADCGRPECDYHAIDSRYKVQSEIQDTRRIEGCHHLLHAPLVQIIHPKPFRLCQIRLGIRIQHKPAKPNPVLPVYRQEESIIHPARVSSRLKDRPCRLCDIRHVCQRVWVALTQLIPSWVVSSGILGKLGAIPSG